MLERFDPFLEIAAVSTPIPVGVVAWDAKIGNFVEMDAADDHLLCTNIVCAGALV